MSIKKDTQNQIEAYRRIVKSSRSTAPERLDDEEFKKLLNKFYLNAEKEGWYCDLSDAIVNKGFFFTAPQRKIAECILEGIFKKDKRTINVSITRQFGKTEVVSMVVSFCYEWHFRIFSIPFRCAIIAPNRNTSSKVFQRAENYIDSTGIPLKKNRRGLHKETVRGDCIIVFGIFEGSVGGNMEGETLHLAVRDEAHEGDDKRYIDEILPALMRTWGVEVNIGNGGYNKCYFYERIAEGYRRSYDEKLDIWSSNYVIRYTYENLREYFVKLAMHGLDSAKAWLAGNEDYIRKNGGRNGLMVRKNIYCEWVLSFGQYLTEEHVMAACVDNEDFAPDDRIYAGFDVGFSGDRSVLALINHRRIVVGWYIIKKAGEMMSPTDQVLAAISVLYALGVEDRLEAFGVDETTTGLAFMEPLMENLAVDIVPFNFAGRGKKHNWYINFQNGFTSENQDTRFFLNQNAVHFNDFKKEVCDIEVSVMGNGFLSFQAPQREGFYDDFVAATVIAANLMGIYEGMFDESILGKVREKMEAMRKTVVKTKESIDQRLKKLGYGSHLKKKIPGRNSVPTWAQ